MTKKIKNGMVGFFSFFRLGLQSGAAAGDKTGRVFGGGAGSHIQISAGVCTFQNVDEKKGVEGKKGLPYLSGVFNFVL